MPWRQCLIAAVAFPCRSSMQVKRSETVSRVSTSDISVVRTLLMARL